VYEQEDYKKEREREEYDYAVKMFEYIEAVISKSVT